MSGNSKVTSTMTRAGTAGSKRGRLAKRGQATLAVVPPAGPKRKRAVGADVLEILRQRIASHVLAPGSRLRENELADEFGVSRARIREAFGALEERGLIVRIANQGAMVARLDSKQVFEIFDVREQLEALCAREAALKAPEGGWDDLRTAFGHALEREIAAGNFLAYLNALVALRKRMIEFADNSIAENMLDLVYDKAQVIARRVVILPGRAEFGRKLHLQLLEAFIARDADAAERVKREIITSAREQVRKYQEFIL